MDYQPTQSDLAAMAAIEAQLRAENRVREQQCKAVLAEVASIVSDDIYAAIVQELAESGSTFDYAIEHSPVGREQDDGAPWGKYFVNQTTNGGYTGDDYAGTVSIPLGDGRFFRFGYSM